MIDVLGVLMGIDIQATTRPEGSDENPFQGSEPAPQASSSSKPAERTPPPKEAEDIEMADEADEEAQAKKAAEAAKTAGGAAYKKRDFDEAIKQYSAAWETWPKDLTFLTNLGGACDLSVLSAVRGKC